MRYSQMLIPTVKEVPAEAEIVSHQLMIRAGFIRKLASGTYTYLPLGWRMLQKAQRIVREEMDAGGAQELMLPMVQPMELWEQTGRRHVMGETLGWFKDRHGRENVLSPTAEEIITSLVAAEVNSYKQLPLNLYQINIKYRDEFRPRFGVLRSREFIMKDAYSFHADRESLDETYQKMYDAYCRIFTRCGLPFVVVEAESGPIGGSASHEFMVPCSAGEDVLFYTEDGSYAANIEKAEVDPVSHLELDGVAAVGSAEAVHTPNVGSIEAVCAFLKTTPAQMIKTLVYQAGERGVVAVVRGDHEINDVKLMRSAGADEIELAGEGTVQRLTGAAVGFAGPVGLLEKLGPDDRMLVDHAVAAMAAGVSGANRTDYHLANVVPGRDFPLAGEKVAVADIRNAVEGDTHAGQPLLSRRGIEIGHVFKLGTKYSETLGATFLDEGGKAQPCIMGCYGIGINRILASAIEVFADANGCVLPVSIAPFEVLVVALNYDSPAVHETADRVYAELKRRGVDVLLDDRAARPGVKFKDADLIGIPLRLVVGEKGLAEGKVELKRRTDDKPTLIDADQAVETTLQALAELWAPLRVDDADDAGSCCGGGSNCKCS